MRLPADRRALEWGLRLAAFAALAWLIHGALTVRRHGGRAAVDIADWGRVRSGWAWHPPADTLEADLRAAPSPAGRDWLAALRRSGVVIAWSDSEIVPAAVEVEARRDPAGGVVARVSGPAGVRVVLTDGLGPLDTLTLGADGGASVRLPPVAGVVVASVSGTAASAAIDTATTHRRILVLGAAGWEARFVAAALAERGWPVDARYALAPRLDVTRGAPFPLDTATHAAVIVLDSTADRYSAMIAAFVRSGGGLVLAGGATGARSASLRVGGMRGAVMRAAAISFEVADPRRALSYHVIQPLAADAVVLEERNSQPVVAARRVGAGRVIQLGYQDTWRWRMEGGEGSVAAHRAWWAGLVAGVAYEPARSHEPGDPAPLASLIDALGPPKTLPPSQTPGSPPYPVVVAALVLCLLGEWLSRRLRGGA